MSGRIYSNVAVLLPYQIDKLIDLIVHVFDDVHFEELLEYRAVIPFAVNGKNLSRRTALAEMVWHRSRLSFNFSDKRIVELLLQYGANPLDEMICGFSLIGWLAEHNQTEMVILFLRHIENINCIVEPNNEFTPLLLAVYYGFEDVLNYVLTRNPQLYMKDENGSTALHLVSNMKHNKEKRLKLAEIILDRCKNLEVQDDNGATPLMKAVCCNRYEIVKLLLQKGANIEATDSDGCTVILLAIWWKRLDLVELLLEYGADSTVTDYDGFNALHYFFKGRCSGRDQSMFELLLRSGCNLNELSMMDTTPLHQFLSMCCSCDYCRYDEVDYVKLLVEHGSLLNIQDIDENSELHLLANNRKAPIHSIIYLLKNGADATLLNEENETFFDVMVTKGTAKKLIKFLVIEDRTGTFMFPEELGTQINQYRKIRKFKKACEDEADVIQTKIFSENMNLSLIRLLLFDKRELTKLSREYSLIDLVEKFSPASFPIYGNDFLRIFNEALNLLKARSSCMLFIREACEYTISFETITVVNNYISNRQLERSMENLISSHDDNNSIAN